MSRDRVAHDNSSFEFCGSSRCVTGGRGEKGRGRKEKSAHHKYDPEYESLQGVSSCCAKTHRRAYHVTPDLWCHGRQLPYSSSLYIRTYAQSTLLSPSTEFYRKSSWRLTCFTTHIYDVRTDCRRGGVHTVHTTKTRSLVHHTKYNVPGSITLQLFSVLRRNLAETIKQLWPWISNFLISC